jgi:hypothetical protein
MVMKIIFIYPESQKVVFHFPENLSAFLHLILQNDEYYFISRAN